MPRASLTETEIDAFRQRACQVATALFAQRGVAGVSMRQIASELGVSAMTPYRYFENKDDLLAMVRTLGFRRFADRQARAFAAASASERMPALAAAYIDFATSEPDAYRVMFELEQKPTDRYPELELEHKRAFGFLVEATREAIDAGRLAGDPVTSAHLLWAQIHGLVSLQLAGKLIMGRTFEELCATPTIAALVRRPS